MNKITNVTKVFKKKVLTPEEKISNVITHFQTELISLQGESENVLDVFKSTVKRLVNINEKIDTKIGSINSQLDTLTSIKNDLISSAVSNNKVKAKFEDFFNI